MAKYKYTYQDWVEGKLDSPYIGSGLVTKELLSQEDFNRILFEQGKAYSEYLNRRLQVLKKVFKYDYEKVLVKEEYIEQEENRVKAWLYHARKHDEYDILSTREYYLDGRESLTKKDVDKYTSGDETFEDILGEVVWMHRLGGSKLFEENKRAHYIISSNYYKWLLWFKEKEALKEPSIEYVETSDREVIATMTNRIDLNKNCTWPTLFKDPKQADVILKLIVEHLSDTGQWLTEPKGRHLVALCTELESKGYLINSGAVSNPLKAEAFNRQFDTTLTHKNFQPNKRGEAEDYREVFRHIPHYQPTP